MSRTVPHSTLVAWFGMAFGTLAMLSLAGCGGEPGQATAKQGGSKFKVAGATDDSTKSGDNDDAAGGADEEGADEAPPAKLFKSKKGSDDSPAKPPVVPSEKLGDFKVPEEPEEIHAYLKRLGERRPRGRTEDESRADFIKIQRARVEAATKLLAFKELEKEVRFEAISAKIEALDGLAQRGDEEATGQVAKFLATLVKDKDPDIGRAGRLMSYDFEIRTLAQQIAPEALSGKGDETGDAKPNTKGDAKPIIARLKKFLAAEEKTGDTFEAVRRTAETLEQLEQQEATIEACRIIGTAFADSEEKNLARAGQSLLDQALLADVGFFEKLEAAVKEDAEAQAELVAAVQKVLAAKALGATAFQQTSQAANIMEFMGHSEPAMKILTMVGKAFKNHPEEKVAQAATEAVANGTKRQGLVGKPFVVEGNLLDGSKFDWSKYKGKVVLLDFWATWCGPCLKELPNIRQNYEKYKDQGFEVVGINCDDDKMAVERFFADKELPWENIHSTDPEALGMNNPLAQKCGVDAIPFLVLINAKGNVEAIHVHGEKLGEKLAAIFGDADPTDGPASPGKTEKPAAETGRKGPPPKKPVDKTGGLVPARGFEDAEGPTYFISFAEDEATPEEEVNPYLADANLTPEELAAFVLKMQDKPKSIQKRPGFGDAVVEAADRILAAGAKDKLQLIAIEAKLASLHKRACLGDEKCDKDLAAFVEALKDDARDKVAREVKFFELERQVIEADKLDLEKVPDMLTQLKEFYAKESLSAKHLRIASSTVAAINRLEDGDAREKEFKEIGNLLAKSSDKQLARYGKKLAKTPAESESKLVGQPLELAGNTAAGEAFKWEAYRGKVVLVDFWATWCGPCRREMPHVKELYEKHRDKGFDVVGVSLDKDLEALADYLQENSIAWTTLSGDETQDLAEKYGVRGIPTMMLVDRDGKILAVSHNVGALTSKLEALLAAPAAAEKPKQ